MKRLLSDEVVKLILDNCDDIGYSDILDMLDNDEIKVNQHREIDEEKSLYAGENSYRIMPVYNYNYHITVRGKKIPIKHPIEVLATTYDSNKGYLMKLVNQYQKFQRKIYIGLEETNTYINIGYNVFYDDEDGMSFNIVNKDDKFTIDELNKIKFYVIK